MTERDKIVAYLRHLESVENASGDHDSYCGADSLREAAEAIENGLHLTFKPEPTIPFETWRDKPSAR